MRAKERGTPARGAERAACRMKREASIIDKRIEVFGSGGGGIEVVESFRWWFGKKFDVARSSDVTCLGASGF